MVYRPAVLQRLQSSDFARTSPCTLFPTNACSRARAFLQRRSRKFETRNATAYAEFVNKLGNKLGTTAYLCRLCPSFLDGEAFFRCRLCWLILGHAAVGVTFVSMQRGSRRSLRAPKILSLQAKACFKLAFDHWLHLINLQV